MAVKNLNYDNLTYYDGKIKDHIQEKVDEVTTIAVSDTEPTNNNVVAWIDSTDTTDYEIPEIKDTETSSSDTWSSKKISEELSAVQDKLNLATTNDIDALF